MMNQGVSEYESKEKVWGFLGSEGENVTMDQAVQDWRKKGKKKNVVEGGEH